MDWDSSGSTPMKQGVSVRHEWRADETPAGVVELVGRARGCV
jgi:hypothetical protein